MTQKNDQQDAERKLASAIKMVVNMLERDGKPARTEAAGELLAAYGEYRETLTETSIDKTVVTDERIEELTLQFLGHEANTFPDVDWVASRTFTLSQWKDHVGALLQSAGAAAPLDQNEQYRLQMAAISTAALGYWRIGDPIKDEYMTVPLMDVANLYAKYLEAVAPVQTAPQDAQPLTCEKCGGEGGHEKALSSTSYTWVDCPTCAESVKGEDDA